MTNERNVGMMGFSTWPLGRRPTDVEARNGHGVGLRYSGGMSSESDPSDLAGKGVFNVWNDRTLFEGVWLDAHGGIVWSEELDLCRDALYAPLCQHQSYPGDKSD